MSEGKIPATFIYYAAEILADTDSGLSGSNIVRETAAYAADYDVNLPHSRYPFQAPNKRTALYENLMAFAPPQQYQIIKELCDHRSFLDTKNSKREQLKYRLVSRYRYLAAQDNLSEINEALINETRHWLGDYPNVLSLYNNALQKFEDGIFHRNLLDDLRLALEELLREVLYNDNPLEKQLNAVGNYIKERGGSKELSNMFVKLIDYFSSYQNRYVKHKNAVIEEEVEFIFEITSSFMKHLIRLGTKE